MKRFQESALFPESENVLLKSRSKLQSYMHEQHDHKKSDSISFLFKFDLKKILLK